MADEKQYQSLYRKYRPQGPQEILGQEHVVRALVGGVREGRLPHAFLFCGPRGTGKTSTARILAKMVNCEKGPTEDPCGTCEQCRLIREGAHLDVVEIDAASHGGVDDARELREKAPTAPVVGREKVYIIDEAQRLSREAFDALLKLLEEPPPGVRFVLATTEPHKMPPTIVGRCQRFDFRRVRLDVLTDHLQRVAKAEQVSLTSEAAATIARQTEGSVRDALSLLDQAALLGEGTVGEEVLASLLGAPPSVVQQEIADAVAVGDPRSIFEIVNRLVQDGHDLRHVLSETLEHFRNLMIAQAVPDDAEVLDVTADEMERLRAQAQKFTPAELSRIVTLLLSGQTDMRWTTSPRLTLELALIRLTMPETDADPRALIARIERLERRLGIQGGGTESSSPTTPKGRGSAETRESPPTPKARPPAASAKSPATEATPSPASEEDEAVPPKPAEGAIDVEFLRRNWATVVRHLRDSRRMILATTLESVIPAAFDGDTLELVFPPDRRFGVQKVEDRREDLKEVLNELFGIAPDIVCTTREVPSSPAEDEGPVSDEEALARVQAELNAEIVEGP